MKDFRYVMTGTLDHPGDLPPKGEFWCKRREKWCVFAVSFCNRLLDLKPTRNSHTKNRCLFRMPEVPGIFHKQEIKE